ncbi:MAG: ATP-binding protein [Anaerolineae bacterium]|nr:ATP-binding protein [Anaerolineae bacterium]
MAENSARPIKEIIAGARTPDELGIPIGIVNDVILRILFQEGRVSLGRFVEIIKVHAQVLDPLVEIMQREHIVEIAKAGTIGRLSYVYSLTDMGTQRAREAFERSMYIGPAPVPLELYNESVYAQMRHRKTVTSAEVQQALSSLILPDGFDRKIGPAINQGSSIFLYGPPGNGKTTVAQAVGELIAGTDPIWIPYAVAAAGAVISVYDELIHRPFHMERAEIQARYGEVDLRWGLFRRPSVMVGGELTMESLDLRFEPIAKYYEAPLQLKANGGMFLIDDFGRQMISPAELLNRWIVPLESEIDFLKLQTGQSFRVPFKQLIVFSTNLDPDDLVDGAFLRRIQMKVGVHGPDEKMFYQLFRVFCKNMDVPFDKDSFLYLLQKHYREAGRVMQAVHPRDLLRVIISLCEYVNEEPHLSPELIDEACDAYFV